MERKKNVNIKYQFYQLCTFDGEDYTEEMYNLLNWFGKIASLSLEETVKEVEGIEGRIEKIVPVYDGKFYAVNFMRLDVISNTYILKKNENARHVDLEEDEYIGKNTVMLYDPKYSIAMLQCNRGSYGAFSLQNYINAFNEDGNLCYFRPIFDNLSTQDLLNSSPIKLDIRFANIREFRPDSKFFERIIKSCEEIECLTAHLECSLGYTKNTELDKETVNEVIEDLRNPINRDSISSARLKLSSDQKSNIVDLFDNVVCDIIPFSIPPRKELDFETMKSAMTKQYCEKGTRNRIYRIFEQGDDN